MSHPDRGFTLLELLITITIIGLLAAIALPSYGDYVLRSNRTVARTAMMRIVGQQEGYYSDRKQYAATLPTLSTDYASATMYLKRDGAFQGASSTDAIYAVTLTDASATAYSVRAVPVNAQARDSRCGTLTYSSTGTKTASGSATDCWTR